MPLLMPILQRGFLDIIQNPPSNPLDSARKLAKVYADYAQAAASAFGPAALTGIEKETMANAMAGSFQPNGAPPSAIGGIVGGLTAFWLTPPVVFGAGVASVVPPTINACLASSFTNPKIPAGVAAAKLANCFDQGTRSIIVASGAPPFSSPIF
jgi:hypothetical protein